MKTVPYTRTTIALDGDVTDVTEARAHLLPPASTACPVCGQNPAHNVDQPHNQQSLYYQYAFYGEYGRWPTWKDAVGHCSPDVAAAWERELRKLNAWSEPP